MSFSSTANFLNTCQISAQVTATDFVTFRFRMYETRNSIPDPMPLSVHFRYNRTSMAPTLMDRHGCFKLVLLSHGKNPIAAN